MRLWVRLALWMALVVVAPLLIIGWLSTDVAATEAERASAAELRRDAAVHADYIGRWLRDQTGQVAAWPQVFPNELGALPAAYQVGFLNAVYRAMPAAVSAALINEQGVPVVHPVYSTSGEERPASSADGVSDLIDRIDRQGCVAAGLFVGEPWLPAGRNLPSVPIAVLVSSEPEPLLLAVELELAAAADLVRGTGPEYQLNLLDGEGGVLLQGDNELIEPSLLGSVLGLESTFGYDAPNGVAVRGGMSPVPYTSWSVVVVTPAALVLKPSAKIWARTATAVFVAVAVSLLLAVVLAGNLSAPIEAVRDTALRLAEGRRGERIEVRRTDEIGDLANAVNHLSEQLDANAREISEQQSEIEAFNQELQGRVEAATQELRAAQAELVRSGQLAAVAEVGAGLAHELNNPLASVLGLAQVIAAKNPDDARMAALVAEASRCRTVVRAMLRLSEGELDPQEAPVVDLVDVLAEGFQLVQGAFRQRGVTLVLEEAQSVLNVRLDPVQGSRMLAQVLHAVRSGLEAGATVNLSANRTPEGLAVIIAPDAPLGMSPSRRDDWRASGHQLWVARQLLDRWGGRLEGVEVLDHGPSVASTLRVVFPGA